MADPQQKLVKVDDSIVAFPQSMPDEHIAIAIKNFRAKKKPQLATDESEHARPLKPAQPLSSAIPARDVPAPPAPVEEVNEETPEPKEDEKPKEKETKYKYGNTQADIPADSEAGKALAEARTKIDKDDLMPSSNTTDGSGVEENSHITIRYGIDGDDTEGIKAYLEKQTPFEATLGKTTTFPPSEHSDGAAPIVVGIESPELHRMEKELDEHGNFIERTFPDYKPHATLAYVRPEAAEKYVGMDGMEGKKFTINSVSISNRDGSTETVELKGTPKEETAESDAEAEPVPETPSEESEKEVTDNATEQSDTSNPIPHQSPQEETHDARGIDGGVQQDNEGGTTEPTPSAHLTGVQFQPGSQIVDSSKPSITPPQQAPTPPPARQEEPKPISNLTFSLTPSGVSDGEKALTQPGDKTLAEIFNAGKIKPSLNALRNESHLRNPKNIIVRDDRGMLHVFKDQQSATAFRLAAGIHEHNGK